MYTEAPNEEKMRSAPFTHSTEFSHYLAACRVPQGKSPTPAHTLLPLFRVLMLEPTFALSNLYILSLYHLRKCLFDS